MSAPSGNTTDTYTAILAYMGENGIAPTIREIMAKTGISSTSVVRYHLRKLRTDGLIRFDDNKARSIRIVTLAETAEGGRG